MRTATLTAIAFLGFLGAALAAPEAASIGQVKSVNGAAFIIRGGARLPAHLGDPLLERDDLETGDNGTLGVTFNDSTLMSLGPRSHVSLHEYRFDPTTRHGNFLARMRRGTLAVTSGELTRAEPGSIRIQTPRAILGVRGTQFLVRVDE
ncbi:MAG TPA: FecR domain-containing protein [Polyangia bacterium]|jgi:hypothetical protein|nr:FecR domain-containing protein [Polyangia bacterium]